MSEIEKRTCPNCNIELDKKYIDEWAEGGQIFKLYYICGICSFGYPIDWRENDE